MARLLPPESSAVEVVSREVGVSVATLERWRANALSNDASDRGCQPELTRAAPAAGGLIAGPRTPARIFAQGILPV